jgi:hypothetical protein
MTVVPPTTVITTVSVSAATGTIAEPPSHLTVKPVLPGNQLMVPDVYAKESTALHTVPDGILVRFDKLIVVGPAIAALVTNSFAAVALKVYTPEEATTVVKVEYWAPWVTPEIVPPVIVTDVEFWPAMEPALDIVLSNWVPV